MNDEYLKVKVVESSWWKCHIDTGDTGFGFKNAHLPKIHALNSMNDKYLKVKESSWWKCHVFGIQDTGDKSNKQRKNP